MDNQFSMIAVSNYIKQLKSLKFCKLSLRKNYLEDNGIFELILSFYSLNLIELKLDIGNNNINIENLREKLVVLKKDTANKNLVVNLT